MHEGNRLHRPPGSPLARIQDVKRVLLVVVDGWTPRVFGPELESGKLPMFRELANRGWLSLECVSIFPSITPAATASIVTGEYPSGHAISGMSWWNPSSGEVSYFGDDVWTVIQRGPGEFLRNFLLQLNGERLQAPTIFQLAERQGKRAACFNHLVFQGDQPHDLTNPWLLRLLPSVGRGPTVCGPSWLCLGDFITSTGRAGDVDAPGGIFNRFGLDDEGTEAFLSDIPDPASLPDVTVAYFADYDFESHDKGPGAAVSTLRRLDARLSRIVEGWGGLDRVLEELCIVMTADHGHSIVGSDQSAAIDMDALLTGYRCADPATGWQNDEELLVCPNMRAAEVFHRDASSRYVRELAGRLVEDHRVDQVIWRESDEDGPNRFRVLTADRGELTFRPTTEATHAVRDEYGCLWDLKGEAGALDISVEEGAVEYGVYPNALERIACGVEYPRVGRIFATAKPGFEFSTTGQSVHYGAGSHGTLHEEDSRVPLLVAGAPGSTPLSATPRIIDVLPICSEILSLRFRWDRSSSRSKQQRSAE